MWSGPRNISTAMMRSWGNRPDTMVWDEPLYAHYLLKTGLDHPGADEVIRCHEPDLRKVVARLTGEVPEGKAIFYQKQMTHHLLPDVDRAWLGEVTNCFLIRDPREMLTSLLKFLPSPTLADTGMPQQVEIFDYVRKKTGGVPPVIDAKDVLADPPRMLAALCEAIGVEFSPAMLSWPPGRRDTDGVWGKYWYAEVEKSSTFRPYKPKDEPVPPQLRSLADECVSLYEQLYRHRMRP